MALSMGMTASGLTKTVFDRAKTGFSATLMCLIALGTMVSGCGKEDTPPPTDQKPTPAPPPPLSTSALPVRLFDVQKEGRPLYALADDFAYCDRLTGSIIVVPKFFVTDFASVPWYGQSVVKTEGPTARAAILHDWLYAVGEKDRREFADNIFLRAMEFYGVGEFERMTAFKAVRIGGEAGYNLQGDFQFLDPAQPKRPLKTPFPKPKTGVAGFLPQCKGFDALIKSGWRPEYLKLRPGGM